VLGQVPVGDGTESLASILLRMLALAAVLYAFLYSIELLGGTFKLLGKDFAVGLIQTTSNPFTGLLIGIVATSLVQSSSTVTSIVVGLVAGGALTVTGAIPVVMGANIGTSVTNIIVALGHMTRPQEFQRAFAGATVHDLFNTCCVTLFLPLEISTHFIERSARWAEELLVGQGGVTFQSPLKMIVKPVVKLTERTIVDLTGNETIAAVIMVILSLGLLFLSLHLLVKLMRRLILGRVEVLMHRYVFRNALAGLLAGVVVTVLVQSSSVTTSLTVPLLAAGFVTVEQIFPVILGANVGTTVTALLASMVTGSAPALVVALAHSFFNIYGILVFYPLRRIPISAAKWLGRMTLRSRLFGVAYVVVVFFLIPLGLIFLTR
jgi:sodium-dependent phosphate cotransporter